MVKSYTAVVDAGHGGADSGATYWHNRKILKEKDFTLDIANRVKKLSDKIPHLNVILTRSTDKYLTLGERALISNKAKANSFVSIHLNSSRSRANGYECFTTKGVTVADRLATIWYEENKKLFPEMKIRADWRDNDPDREADFSVLSKTKAPAILTEHGFLNGKEDILVILNKEKRELMAQSIVNSLCRFHQIDKEDRGLETQDSSPSMDEKTRVEIKKRIDAIKWQISKIEKSL